MTIDTAVATVRETPPSHRRVVSSGEPVVTPAVLRAVTIALVLTAAAAAFVSGMSYLRGDRTLVVLPVVAMAALALGILAVTRFSFFVLLLLAVRPTLDLFKLSGNPTGTAAGNTAAVKGMDPSSILAVLFLLTALLWLAARHYSGRKVPTSRLGVALSLFVVAGFLSVLGSSHIQASAMEALRVGSVAMMFLVVEQLIDSRKTLIRVVVVCYVGLLYPLLYTSYGMVAGHPGADLKGGFSRLSGPFGQANTFARYLAFMIIMGVALHPYVRRGLKWVFASLTLLSAGYMTLTLTRTAIIGALVGVIVVAVVQRRRGLLIGLGIAALAGLFLLPGVAARFGTLGAQSTIGGGPTGNTLEWRLRYWAEVLPLANHNPITGIGLDVTQFQTDAAKQPHNDFIRAYVEMGVVGLITFVAMLTALVGNARRAVGRAARGTIEHAVAAGALGAAVALVLECAAANVMSNVVSLWYLIAFAGCAAYISRTHGGTPAEQAGGAEGGVAADVETERPGRHTQSRRTARPDPAVGRTVSSRRATP